MESNAIILPELLKTLQAKQEAFFCKDTLALYIPPKVSQFVGDNAFLDAEVVVKNWLVDDKSKCLLLLGDSGSGKTLWGQRLCYSYWEAKDTVDFRIPLFIPLLKQREPIKNLVDGYLEDTCQITDKTMRDAIGQQPLLLILDGYDEIYTDVNLYHSNQLWRLPDAKIIFTCRHLAFINTPDYLRLFYPCDANQTIQSIGLAEYVMHPFTADQVQGYVEKYVKHFQPTELEGKDGQGYSHLIDQFLGLTSFVRSPYVLYLVMQALPHIMLKYKDKAVLEKMHLARIDLYHYVVRQVFDRQKKKLLDAHQISDVCPIEAIFKAYNQSFATALLEAEVESITYHPVSVAHSSLHQPQIFAASSTAPASEHPNIESTFLGRPEWVLGSEKIKLPWMLSASFLMLIGKHRYAFLDKSWLDYFGALKLFESHLSYASILLAYNLNENVLTKQSDRFVLLVQKVKQDSALQQLLFDIVEASRYEKHLYVMSANAMTLLNYAGISFSGKNLQRIQIPGADLSHANLQGVDFSMADLRRVDFSQATLMGVKFGGAIMAGVIFKEKEVNPAKTHQGMEFGGAIGLDLQNKHWFEKWGALGKPSRKGVQQALKERHFILPYDSKQPPTNWLTGQHFITPQSAMVNIAYIKSEDNNQPVFLLIEAIQSNYYTITKANLTKEKDPLYSAVEICPKSLVEMQRLVTSCDAICFKLTSAQVSLLLLDLEADHKSLIKQDISPATWCMNHLTKIGIDVKPYQSWFKPFTASSPTNTSATSEKCLIM